MAIRETAKSLKLYFGWSGGAAVLVGVLDVANGAIVLGLIAVALGGAYLFVAMRLDSLLDENAGLIRQILYVSSGLMVVGIVADVALQNGAGITREVIGLLINWYLLVNVKRLAREATSNPSSRTAG